MSFFKRIWNFFKGTSQSRKDEEEKKQEKDSLEANFADLKISDSKFSYQSFIQGLKNKKYSHIVFMTGAGISVSAGIPDFRTPGTGLYSRLQEYNLPFPEAIFDISFFSQNPMPFYILSKEFFSKGVSPTTSHFFQKMIYDMGILLQIFTQNIDGLELNAGIPLEKICQAHGHYRTCHCIECGKEHDMKIMNQLIIKEQRYECDQGKCRGLIKPDIVFFGEELPQEFSARTQLIHKADLVIIMGTSLVVFPFAAFAKSIPSNVPVVLINKENSLGSLRENFIFLEGDLDKSVLRIVEDLNMKDEYQKIQHAALKNNDK